MKASCRNGEGVSILNGRFLLADGPGFKKPVGRAVYLLTFTRQRLGGRKSSFAVPCQKHQGDTENLQEINSRSLRMTRVLSRVGLQM